MININNEKLSLYILLYSFVINRFLISNYTYELFISDKKLEFLKLALHIILYSVMINQFTPNIYSIHLFINEKTIYDVHK